MSFPEPSRCLRARTPNPPHASGAAVLEAALREFLRLHRVEEEAIGHMAGRLEDALTGDAPLELACRVEGEQVRLQLWRDGESAGEFHVRLS